jgi:hypothetical protein
MLEAFTGVICWNVNNFDFMHDYDYKLLAEYALQIQQQNLTNPDL